MGQKKEKVQNKGKEKIRLFIRRNFKHYMIFTAFLVALLPAFWIATISYCSIFYVHEAGHMAYGTLDNLINGKPSKFEITAGTTCPMLDFFKIPSQTTMRQGNLSLNYIFGGSILTILAVSFLSYIVYKFTKNKASFLFIVLFLYHEIMGNFLCGTDNILGRPYNICSTTFAGQLIQFFFPLYMLLIAYIITSYLIKPLELFYENVLSFIKRKKRADN